MVENPKNIELIEAEAAQLPRSLPDVDIAVINGNYAIQGGLKVSDALAAEDKDALAATTFANIITVKEGREEDEAIVKPVSYTHLDVYKRQPISRLGPRYRARF